VERVRKKGGKCKSIQIYNLTRWKRTKVIKGILRDYSISFNPFFVSKSFILGSREKRLATGWKSSPPIKKLKKLKKGEKKSRELGSASPFGTRPDQNHLQQAKTRPEKFSAMSQAGSAFTQLVSDSNAPPPFLRGRARTPECEPYGYWCRGRSLSLQSWHLGSVDSRPRVARWHPANPVRVPRWVHTGSVPVALASAVAVPNPVSRGLAVAVAVVRTSISSSPPTFSVSLVCCRGEPAKRRLRRTRFQRSRRWNVESIARARLSVRFLEYSP
jgi:hypothetical protein